MCIPNAATGVEGGRGGRRAGNSLWLPGSRCCISRKELLSAATR